MQKNLIDNKSCFYNIWIVSKKITNLNRLLPLVAIGTVADCQSVLESTNRMLVRAGLKILQNKQNQISGLNIILSQLGFLDKIKDGYQLTSQELAFYLSPILNSSGRINHARLSIRSLLSETFSSKNFDENLEAKEMQGCQSISDYVQKLITTNQDRKDLVKKILNEVEMQANKQFLDGESLIWLEGNWSKGIIGLLASRLVNQYNLPVVVIEKPLEIKEKMKVSASLRAPEGFSLPKAMNATGSDLFVKYGGHPGAAGFTCLAENLAKIKNAMKAYLKEQMQALNSQKINYQDANFEKIIQEFVKKTKINTNQNTEILNLKYQKNLIYVETKELNQDFLQGIMNLDPFGQDFPFPYLLSIFNNYSVRWLGLEQKHARINFANNYFTVFNLSNDFKQKLLKSEINSQKPEPILAVLKLNQNTFRGATNLDLIAEIVF